MKTKKETEAPKKRATSLGKKQQFDYVSNGNMISTYFLGDRKAPEVLRYFEREINDAVLCVVHKLVQGPIETVKKKSLVVKITDHDVAILNSYIRDGYADYGYKSKETRLIEISNSLVEAVNRQWKPKTPTERANALYPIREADDNRALNEAYLRGCEDTMERVLEQSSKMMSRVLRRVLSDDAVERYLINLEHEIKGE